MNTKNWITYRVQGGIVNVPISGSNNDNPNPNGVHSDTKKVMDGVKNLMTAMFFGAWALTSVILIAV